jgi:hypothetical protein
MNRRKCYFGLFKLLGTGQEEKVGPDDPEQEDINGTREIE